MKTNAITYLLLIKIKNNIKQLFKKPARLIYAIVLIALVVFTVVARDQTSSQDETYSDIRILTAGLTAFYILMFLLISYNGFKNGASMFKMADVNLLFVSPVSPQKTLFYGLFQQLGTSLLLGFFMIFQYTWLNSAFGVTFGELIFLLLGYSLTVFIAQLTAMVIYSFTSHDEKKKRIALFLYYGIIILYVLGTVMYLLKDMENVVPSLVRVGNSIFIRLMPAGGWIGGVLAGILLKDLSMMLLGVFVTLAFIGVMMILLSRTKQDYYEDVLKASEDQHMLSSAKKEGRLVETTGKVKVGKTGITRGDGANTFYYKHKLEDRRARKFILEPISIGFLVATIIFTFFMKGMGILPIFIYSTYMQLISVKMGRFSKELGKQYIYLIPETSFKKIFYSIAEAFTGFLTEAVVLYVVLASILKLSPYEVIVLILARISFSYLLTAANILIQRVFGTLSSRTLIYMFYMLAVLVMAAPGVVAGILISMSGLVLLSQYVLPFLGVIACNILVTLLVIYLCKDVLKYAELK